MKQRTTQLDFKIDQNTAATWEYLKQKYHGKKPDDIFQLALETLANGKRITRMESVDTKSFDYLIEDIDEISNDAPFDTETEFYDWWNKNKSELRL